MDSYGRDSLVGGVEMKWDVNKIIAIGLVVMGVMAVIIWGLISYKTGTNTGTEIPIGIISGLTGVLTGKKMAEYEIRQQSKTAETLDKISTVAEEGKNIANAVEAIKQIGKKG